MAVYHLFNAVPQFFADARQRIVIRILDDVAEAFAALFLAGFDIRCGHVVILWAILWGYALACRITYPMAL
jgi:hypothetical protein